MVAKTQGKTGEVKLGRPKGHRIKPRVNEAMMYVSASYVIAGLVGLLLSSQGMSDDEIKNLTKTFKSD